ncbi:response regulator transcription factor [Belnapia moabensis]|uniref:response regulator transcription factor n=1 Tax=Belnapia moabensis TaxID=365533 RepID=UPI00316ACA88
MTSNAQPRQNESLACFSVDGQRCDIVCENASFNGRAVVGTLILGERTYLVLGGKAEAVPDLMVLLTPRELDIAVLVSKGWKVKEIARRLDISFNTVRVHTGRIYAKLNMHKQSELAICVAKQSWPRRRAASISDDFQKKTRNRRELGRRHPAFPAL